MGIVHQIQCASASEWKDSTAGSVIAVGKEMIA